jgi:MoaA/NifB/PqqE/SkfB family radical SAM enzyme
MPDGNLSINLGMNREREAAAGACFLIRNSPQFRIPNRNNRRPDIHEGGIMGWKYAFRTIRNAIFHRRPYFAHLATTHRCNMRCRFCHIQESPCDELDLKGMKRVIDILDQMGIGVISVSGGGEPLLREDSVAILDYAAEKGLYTKITSNGTVSPDRYRELLQSKVAEIAISLDGVDGDDLPYSHVSPKILKTVRRLNDNLPKGKSLTLNVTISQNNRARVDEIVHYCTREYPRARIWLNPVVVGDGKLRTGHMSKVSPDYLRKVNSPVLVKANFFIQAAEEQYRNATFNWGCLAGAFSFDIKPNGDFWICQDQPSRPPLNILDPDFIEKHRRADFSYRSECSGCTYSCYFVTQKLFEPCNWADLGRMWWTLATGPNERCRSIARKYGWFAGLLYFCTLRNINDNNLMNLKGESHGQESMDW